MDIVMVAAVAEHGVIGRGNRLPWHLPADLRFLQAQIRDSYLVTGRRSWESPQGQELFPGREGVILLTRQQDYRAEGARVAHSIGEALDLARSARARRCCILGGEGVYAAAMPHADILALTEVHGTFEGDAFFPDIDRSVWQTVYREDHPADAEHDWPFSFVFYRRREPLEEVSA